MAEPPRPTAMYRSAHDRLCDEIVAYAVRQATPTCYVAICDATAPNRGIVGASLEHDAKVSVALVQLRHDRRVPLVGREPPSRPTGELCYIADRAKNAAELEELLS